MAKSKKWTPERRAKFKATWKAKRTAKGTALQPTTTRDAVLYLTHAERGILARVRSGAAKRIAGPDLLTLLALATLRGEV